MAYTSRDVRLVDCRLDATVPRAERQTAYKARPGRRGLPAPVLISSTSLSVPTATLHSNVSNEFRRPHSESACTPR